MRYPLVIIGAGLAGLAAGIRFARFGEPVLILEKHNKPGGLNSYYTRQGHLLETGLHAMTNFAPRENRHAPLNKLFRQLKLSRRDFTTHQQYRSEIRFAGGHQLAFSNDFQMLQDEIARLFPASIDNFIRLTKSTDEYDPFTPTPWVSTREQLSAILQNELLENMLLWPIMLYGNSEEHDMDFSQFVILFRSIFREGLFRPAGNMRDFLSQLVDYYQQLGGEIRFQTGVEKLETDNGRVSGVRLTKGECIECDQVLSTAGFPTTMALLANPAENKAEPVPGNISLYESIYLLPVEHKQKLQQDLTMVFYNNQQKFCFCKPKEAVDLAGGVICFSDNFQGLATEKTTQIRVTHLANFDRWQLASKAEYQAMKKDYSAKSARITADLIGDFQEHITFQDSFTPMTIARYTGKARGAVYGMPRKIKDGLTNLDDLIIAGTDQGFLGIIGSMLSGVAMVNRHILQRSSHAA